jgi:hypothetical protein
MHGKNLQITRPRMLLVAVILTAALAIPAMPSPVSAGQPDAAAAISSAQNTLLSCYDAAKEAETAGANITVLLSTLNEAGALFSRAELAYSTGDFNASQNLALESQNKLGNFIPEANALKETAAQQRSQDFLVNVIAPIIGAIGVIVVSAAVWVFLKRKYGTAGLPANEPSQETPA